MDASPVSGPKQAFPSGSKSIPRDYSSTRSSVSQHDLTQDFADAIWQMDANHLARGFSTKTCKTDYEITAENDHLDDISNYEVGVDAWDDVVEKRKQPFETFGANRNEQSHCESLAKYLSDCIGYCTETLGGRV